MGNIDKKTGSSGATWLVSIAAVPLIAIGVYYGFSAALPVCGPPRSNLLGQIYLLVCALRDSCCRGGGAAKGGAEPRAAAGLDRILNPSRGGHHPCRRSRDLLGVLRRRQLRRMTLKSTSVDAATVAVRRFLMFPSLVLP